MKCPRCQVENSATSLYCRNCGEDLKKVDYSKIHSSLKEKAETEEEDATEREVRRYLVIALFILLLAITFKIVFMNPPKSYIMPSSGKRFRGLEQIEEKHEEKIIHEVLKD